MEAEVLARLYRSLPLFKKQRAGALEPYRVSHYCPANTEFSGEAASRSAGLVRCNSLLGGGFTISRLDAMQFERLAPIALDM